MKKKQEDNESLHELLNNQDIKVANLIAATRQDGSKFYLYLLMTFRQVEALHKKMAAREQVNFEDFGEVLEYGEGSEPPEDIKKKVEEEYGFDHMLEQKILEGYKDLKEEYERIGKYNISVEEFVKKKMNETIASNSD